MKEYTAIYLLPDGSKEEISIMANDLEEATKAALEFTKTNKGQLFSLEEDVF